MAVIGIDPGTAITGYGIVLENENGNLQAIDYGAILTDKSSLPEVRLLHIYKQLREVLLIHKPDCGAVERLYFQQNVRTALSVGQARGVILLALADAQIPVYEYNPVDVKQAVSGYGRADKKQIQQMIKMLLNLDEAPQPDDAADALAVAICHIQSHKILGLSK